MSLSNRSKSAIPGSGAIALQRKSLHDLVVDRLREMIVFGELKPGDRIVENDLAEQLGVSRTPLREAIKTLTLDGLVDSPIHRGARVKPFEPAEIQDLFDVIACLEALAAQRAAERIAATDLEELETLHADMQAHFAAGDRDSYFDLNSRIHDRIVEMAENETLLDIHRRLMLRARRGRYFAIVSPDRWTEALDEHEALMRALRAKSGSMAFEIWRQHLLNTGNAVLASCQMVK